MNARVAQLFGGRNNTGKTELAAAATVRVPDNASFVYMTGTDTITSLQASATSRGRLVVFHQQGTGTTTFTNTNDTTTANEMDVGGSNFAMAQGDVLALYLRADGSWVRVFSSDN